MKLRSLGLFLFAAAMCYAAEDKPLQTLTMHSNTYQIDRVIKSMEGAIDNQPLTLLQSPRPELLWVTSADVTVIDAETASPKPAEMLCHSHLMFPYLNFNRAVHNNLFGGMTNLDLKLFTIVQGQNAIKLPKNFGIPVRSDEKFEFSSMIISPQKPETPLKVKAKGNFEFYRDQDLSKPLKPLFWRGLSLMVPLKSGDHASEQCDSEMQGISPHPMDAEPAKASMNLVHTHGTGKFKQSYHWMVPPGRHEYRYVLEYGLMTPFDTTLHYMNMHLHPYAESLELRDITAGKTLFKGLARNLKNGAGGIGHLSHFSTEKGLPVYTQHRYELIAVYNNTTPNDIDAMAIMFIYMLDKNFDRDKWKALNAA